MEGAPTDRPAGWYPDPQREGQLRYWDGSSWTRNRAERKPNFLFARLRRTWPVVVLPAIGVAVYLIFGAPKAEDQGREAVDIFRKTITQDTAPVGAPGKCLRAAEVFLQVSDLKADVFAPNWQTALERACRDAGPAGSVQAVARAARADVEGGSGSQ